MKLSQDAGFVFLGVFPPGRTGMGGGPSAQSQNVLLLALPYVPYESSLICAYYTAHNYGYGRFMQLFDRLAALGVHPEHVKLPLRKLALVNDVGVQLKSQLLALPGIGTMFALYALALDSDVCAADLGANMRKPCENCSACIDACPTGALGQSGFDKSRCFRNRFRDIPDFIKEKLSQFLGCEICQRVCPVNGSIMPVPAPAEVIDAFELKRLLEGEVTAARALIGQNVSKTGLMAQAAVLAANRHEHGLAPLVEELGKHHKSLLVKDCATWASKKMFSHYV